MASTKEIKNRIKSVRDTQKITNAMYLISSTKMRKAKRDAEKTKPYFDLLRREIRRMFAVGNDLRSRYFDSAVDEEKSGGRFGILVITADKGLAGSYNQNVIREADKLIARSDESTIYVVGDYGWRYFRGHNYNVETAFEHSMNEPTLAMARDITFELLGEFEYGDFDRLYVCYTDFRGGLSAGEAVYDRLIPFDRDDFVPEGDELDSDASTVFEYEPDVKTVLERSIQSSIVGYVYSALVNSYCSEQNARMMAMEAANDNASDLLAGLQLEYNHLRQNAITQEITEISSGARSLKKKRK
ncbi:MAG: ATP synthase F1 subunit gamma [Mogibacterium sp.]|nr:ATP synthase F1 subunit gamma [Bacillota bacterium]MBQ3291878.1 ATP synthase F1 subunit gamma [Mogibacterium sp.]